jgi:hypothetical protein
MCIVVYYVIENSLFTSINANIMNIHNSEQRLNYIIDITLRTRNLILINEQKVDGTPAALSALV